MNKHLPSAWIAIACTKICVSLAAMTPLLGGRYQTLFNTKLTGLALSAVVVLTIAGIYALLNRVVTRRAVFWLGWGHAAAYLVMTLGVANVEYRRSLSLVSGERLPVSDMLIPHVILVIATYGSTLLFFAVVLAAYRDTRRRIELQAFD